MGWGPNIITMASRNFYRHLKQSPKFQPKNKKKMVNFLLCFWEIFFNLLLGNFAFFASCCVLYCKVLCSFSVFFFSISSTECFIGITPEASFPFHRPHMFDTNRWRGAAGRGPCFSQIFHSFCPSRCFASIMDGHLSSWVVAHLSAQLLEIRTLFTQHAVSRLDAKSPASPCP